MLQTCAVLLALILAQKGIRHKKSAAPIRTGAQLPMRDRKTQSPSESLTSAPERLLRVATKANTIQQPGMIQQKSLKTRHIMASGLVIVMTYKEAWLDGRCLLRF